MSRFSTQLSDEAVQKARMGIANVSEDDEQKKKFEEIVELFLAAGYFRARISSLTQFDKILGGLAWCITASNVDLDINLFFDEEAQIKQKIELGEHIEQALYKMKCPHALRTYQIRGLDTEHIFPVVQWLVKKVIEVRKETGDLLRVFTESQFVKSYKALPEDVKFEGTFVSEVAASYLPRRRYRRAKGKPQDEQSQVLSTLLEYGYRGLTGVQYEEDQDGDEEGGSQIRSGRRMFKDEKERLKAEAEARAKAEEERVSAVMKTMEQAYETVGASTLTGLVDTDMIRQIASSYTAKGSETAGMDEAQIQKYFGAEMHKRQVASRTQQIEEAKERLAQVQAEYQQIEERHRELLEEYEQKVALNNQTEAKIKKLCELETAENTHLLQSLRQLVALNETLKIQETTFRGACKRQMDELKAEIEKLRRKTGEGLDDDEEQARIQMIEETHATDTAKVKMAQSLLSKKNRDILLVDRKIDDVPSRTELQQYQKMFIELYEQVQSKFIETRKYYSSYNTLVETKDFLEKEVSILNSIDQNFKAAISSKENRERLVSSLKGIIDGVKSNLGKVEAKLAEERAKKEKLNGEFQAAVEKERQYYKMTKEFLVECAKNEKLLAQLEGDD